MREQYISYDETLDFFYRAEEENPSLVKVEKIGKTWENRDIIAVKITADIDRSYNKPAVFYTGTIHAREWIGIELAVEFSRYLLEQYKYNPKVKNILKKSVFYVVPTANPDGFEYSRNHYSFWRKNRRKNADGSFGVDLNRNFSIGWRGNNNPSSNVYSGPSPFSEPETKALKEFVENHPNITIALDYHSQGNVFFPAHNFKHEDSIDTTDIDVLCANMAEEIRKVSSREYGIHQGKPPASLISGSGREFYHSLGIIATVVEVGSRNISDYVLNMQEHINEHIPALLFAMEEAPNYQNTDSLERVEDFSLSVIESDSITLNWTYLASKDIYFEIYRNKKDNSFCQESNLIAVTKELFFTDKHLESATRYFYYIRAVDLKRNIKSPFAPKIEVRTDVAVNEFSKVLFPIKTETGYLSEKSNKNSEHFGANSLFSGVNKRGGVSYSVISFPLNTVPKNAIITSANLSVFPLNRVAVHIERFGEWKTGIINSEKISDITNFDEVKNSEILSYMDQPINSFQLTQGIWKSWKFSEYDCSILEQQIHKDKVIIRLEGPTKLPRGRDSQMMQWDLGYGKFGQGLAFRPTLKIKYTLPSEELNVNPTEFFTINKNSTKTENLEVGFNELGEINYGLFSFDIGNFLNLNKHVITDSFLEIVADKIKINSDIHLHIEAIEFDETHNKNYENLLNSRIIERVGYDVNAKDLEPDIKQEFSFDNYVVSFMTDEIKNRKKIYFKIVPTSSKPLVKNQLVSIDTESILLSLNFIPRRIFSVGEVSNFNYKIENNKIKLFWENPKHKDFKGVIVVKNPFRIPLSPYDGQKVYGGTDNFTFDTFGALDVDKFFAVFTYDEVPNFSEPMVIFYSKQ
jgi:hypothetical protein